MHRRIAVIFVVLAAFAAGFASHTLVTPEPAFAQTAGRVFELRTYTVNDGHMANVHLAFRDYLAKSIFPRLGMENVIYLAPTDTAQAKTTFIYIIAHKSREAANQSWAAFRTDTAATRVLATVENKDGRAVARVDRVFATALDFSSIK